MRRVIDRISLITLGVRVSLFSHTNTPYKIVREIAIL
jgi:hypothetical protein